MKYKLDTFDYSAIDDKGLTVKLKIEYDLPNIILDVLDVIICEYVNDEIDVHISRIRASSISYRNCLKISITNQYVNYQSISFMFEIGIKDKLTNSIRTAPTYFDYTIHDYQSAYASHKFSYHTFKNLWTIIFGSYVNMDLKLHTAKFGVIFPGQKSHDKTKIIINNNKLSIHNYQLFIKSLNMAKHIICGIHANITQDAYEKIANIDRALYLR